MKNHTPSVYLYASDNDGLERKPKKNFMLCFKVATETLLTTTKTKVNNHLLFYLF